MILTIEEARNQYKGAIIYEGAKICDGAIIYDGAKICEGAKIYGGAIIYEGATIGEGAKIYGGAIIYEGATIGEGAKICEGAIICEGATIGEGAIIREGAKICEGVVISKGAIIYEGAVIGKFRKNVSHSIVINGLGTTKNITAYKCSDGLIINIGCANDYKGLPINEMRELIAKKYNQEHEYFDAMNLCEKWYNNLNK